MDVIIIISVVSLDCYIIINVCRLWNEEYWREGVKVSSSDIGYVVWKGGGGGGNKGLNK